MLFRSDFEGAPAYEVLKEFRSPARARANHMLRIARRLEVDQKELVDLLGSRTPRGLEDDLKAATSRLREDAKTLRRETSRRYLSPALALMLVVGYVEEKTGTPHYRDVSLLLETAYATFGAVAQGSVGDEAIRKAVDRFKRRNPSFLDANGK